MIEVVEHYGNVASQHLLLQASCIFTLTDEAAPCRQRLPAGVSVVGVLKVEEARALCVMPDLSVYELKTFPAGYLAAVAFSEKAQAELGPFVAFLMRLSGRKLEPPERIDGAGSMDRLLWFFSKLCLADRTRLLRSNLAGQLELAELRHAHETLQSDFQAVESFIASRDIQPADIVFYNPVSSDLAETSDKATLITQTLPVANYGLSSIDLATGPSSGRHSLSFGLDCSMMSVESGEVLARWALPIDEINPGWINLRLPRGLSGASHTLRLVIRPLNGIGFVPSLKLGHAQPLKAFRARLSSDATRELAASLALRCWSGLPGVAPPAVTTVVTPQTDTHHLSVRTVPLSSSFLARIEQCQATWFPDFEPVSFNRDLSVVECHPPPAGITMARLPRLSLPAVCRVEAQAFVRGASSAPVEFGIVFTDAAERQVFDALGRERSSPALANFSGWTSVEAASASLLQCAISDAGSAGSLYLTTRMKDGASNDFARACFRTLRITSLAPQASDARHDVEVAAKSPGTRRIGREDLDLIVVEHGSSASCAVRVSAEGAVLDLRDPAEDPSVFSLRGLAARSAVRVAVRATLSSHGNGPVDFGFGVFAGDVARQVTMIDLENPIREDSPIVFSGWTHLSPSDSAAFEIDIAGTSEPDVSLLFTMKGGGPAGCVTLSDLWLIVDETQS